MRDENGQLGGLEGLAFGVLVFVFGTLIVINAWAVVDSKLAAAAAAREAARAFVESADLRSADSAALQAASDAIEGYGRDPDRMEIRRDDTSFGRCERVTFTVEYKVSLGAIPFLDRPAGTFVAGARHSEIVDPFRDRLRGEAGCVG
jgi:hypothetical protein